MAGHERKRSPLGDLTNEAENVLPRRRARLLPALTPARSPTSPPDAPAGGSGAKVSIQRFSLVSRDAPPTKRAPSQHSILLAPPRLAAQLGPEIQVCRCSQCPGSGAQEPMSTTSSPGALGFVGRRARLCRQDTEAHPEYELLLAMNRRFQAECKERCDGLLVGDACCRDKTAYFILGPGATTVGYVAAVVAANRRARRAAGGRQEAAETEVPPDSPLLLHVWVEPEFRRRGFATAALALLLRGHAALLADDPPWPVLRMIEGLGFRAAGSQDGAEGRPLVTFARGAAGA